MQDDNSSPFAAERALLEDALREAGAVAMSLFRTELKHWTKNVSSPVSEADIAANDIIRRRLSAAYPQDGWLSEESEDDPARFAAPRVWVIDPIDGTRAYLAGRDDWCLSAALVIAGRPVAAVIHAPAVGQTFSAETGRGARVNGRPVTVTDQPGLSGAAIGGPRPLLENLDLRAAGARLVPRIGSLALRLARVAEGTIDAAIARPDSHDWDLAAADLLVHEAGGLLTGLSGESIVYNRPEGRHGLLVAAGHAVHRQLLTHMGALSHG